MMRKIMFLIKCHCNDNNLIRTVAITTFVSEQSENMVGMEDSFNWIINLIED